MNAADVLADARMYARFAACLPGFLRQRLTLEQAEAIVRRRLQARDDSFLRMVERGIYGHARSPYLPLLKLAGCELDDLRRMVRDRGLEATLLALRQAGVYVSFEEFKGRAPIVRQGREIEARPRDFDNPFHSPAYVSETGGTTGAGTRIEIDLHHLAASAPLHLLALATHGVLEAPMVLWRGVLPDASGVANLLRTALFRKVPERWFSPLSNHHLAPALKHRLATRSVVAVGRLLGIPFPWPQPLGLERAEVVADAVSELLREHRSCLVSTTVSLALRVAAAAQERGLDLSGTTFMGAGEPPTPAKVRGITQGGARYVPMYFFNEAGFVGVGCARPEGTNDLHFMRDTLALIQHPRQVPGSQLSVPAFHFTSLLPTTPKILLNTESDDYGILERRSCGCLLDSLGYVEHLREVRSFRKLTGEGVTLVGSEMERILEEVLPARFGGGPLDYQLAEEEDERGFTRLSLLASPRLGPLDEQSVVACVLAELRSGSGAANVARAIWAQAGTFRVKRQEPVWTARGKLMPLHLEQRAAGTPRTPAESHRSRPP